MIHGTDLAKTARTLADVLQTIELHSDLSPTRKRDLCSDLKTLAKWLDRPLSAIKVDTPDLRNRLSKLHHVQLGVSEKRFKNVCAGLKASISLCLPKPVQNLERPERTEAWVALLEACPKDWERYRLARFADYCSELLIHPEYVDDETVAAFRAHLGSTNLKKDPELACAMVVQTWNNLVKRDTEFDLLALMVKRSDKYWTTPLTELPPSFQTEVEAYLICLGPEGRLTENGPDKPLRPNTIENHKVAIRNAASALIESGTPASSVTSLAMLTEFNNFATILQFFLDRNGGEPPTWLSGLAAKLISIAKHHVNLPEQDLKALGALQKRVRVTRRGLSAKNQLRLGQFNDWDNVSRLILLPVENVESIQRKPKPSRWDALKVMCAVAVDILLCVPMRRANLVALDIDGHITWRGTGKGRYASLFIPPNETKNGLDIDADLPQDVSRRLRLYIEKYRSIVCPEPGPFLFPKANGGGHRTPEGLGDQVQKFIYRQTGLEMNAHLFRHLSAMLFLMKNPGQYETVRLMLRHKSVDTTMNFYADMKSKWALNHYYEHIIGTVRGLDDHQDKA